MKEIDKFYTPEIEEFHVGFEFEARPKGSEIEFNKFVLHIGNGIENWFSTSEIRVKYLDKEDIEELGWIHSKHTINEWNYGLDNIQYELILYDNNIIKISNKYPLGKTSYDHKYSPIFLGIIKNKSELKKLMSQLNIIK